MTTIIAKIRDLIEDNLIRTTDYFEYISSKIFTLSEANIDATSLVCYKNGVIFAPANYSYSSTTGKVTVTGTLVAGDILEFIYNAYNKFSDAELKGYIRATFSYLAIEKYNIFSASGDTITPTPTNYEEHLMALIATILIKGNITGYKTPELSVSFSKEQSKEDKIKQIISQYNKNYGTIEYIDLKEEIAVDEEE